MRYCHHFATVVVGKNLLRNHQAHRNQTPQECLLGGTLGYRCIMNRISIKKWENVMVIIYLYVHGNEKKHRVILVLCQRHVLYIFPV